MRSLIILGLLLCFIVIAQIRAKVTELETFADLHNAFKDKSAVIEFYSPKCPHCTAIRAEYENLAKKYSGHVNFYRVSYDNPLMHQFFDEYNIQSMPTFKYIKNGSIVLTEVGTIQEKNIKTHIDS